jgi:cadmium resistance protein CadD (predicted permease)
MASLMMTLIVATVVFAATNIDDIFVLLGFLADQRYRARHIIFGQCLGMAALVIVSIVAARIALIIPAAYIGLLGIVPAAIGIKQLVDAWRGEAPDAEQPPVQNSVREHGRVLAVAAVTVANGGDNIAVYTPLFAVRSAMETLVIIAVFAVMTILWCAAARWLVYHPTIGAPIRRYGHRLLPFILIGLGIFIMVEARTFAR